MAETPIHPPGDEAALDTHVSLPHTVAFIAQAGLLINHPLDTNRTERIG